MSADSIAGGKRPTDSIIVAGSGLERAGTTIQWSADEITPEALAAQAADVRRIADELAFAAVIFARQDGRSWELIGTMLGITRQAAHKAYAHRLPTTLA